MASLKSRFEELIHITWTEFVALETDKTASVDDSVLCSLIRVCADTDDISSIKLAFDRVDGLLETPVEIKVPKFYIRYIKATEQEPGTRQIEAPEDAEKEKASNYNAATAKLRETLVEMRRMPQDVIRLVRLQKRRIDTGKTPEHDPMVKSVIVANLLKQVQRGRFKAVELVFDQIDGKLTRTITLLGGEDVYIDNYTETIAPAHATLDKKGVYVAENKAMTNIWIRGFAQSQKGLESLADSLEDDKSS